MDNMFGALSDQLADAVEAAGPSIVQLAVRRRPSAGVVFAEGLVLAPVEAIEEDAVVVRRGDGQTFEGHVLGRAHGQGFGVVRVPELGANAMLTAPDPRVGHLAIAVGRTWSGNVMASITSVAVVGGPLRTGRASRLERVIRIAQSPHGGLTGGALVDDAGRALGVITSSAIRDTTVVIPASLVWPMAQQMVAEGGTRQGYLGVGTAAVALPPRQQADGRFERGLLVTSAVDAAPADAAGVLVGDIMVALDGGPLREPDDLLMRLRGETAGRQASLTVIRGVSTVDLPITIGERPARAVRR